jgi:hypothetical protein
MLSCSLDSVDTLLQREITFGQSAMNGLHSLVAAGVSTTVRLANRWNSRMHASGIAPQIPRL